MRKSIYVPRATGNNGDCLLVVLKTDGDSHYVQDVGRLDDRVHLIGRQRWMKATTLKQYRKHLFISVDEIPDGIPLEGEMWAELNGVRLYPEWVLHKAPKPVTPETEEVTVSIGGGSESTGDDADVLREILAQIGLLRREVKALRGSIAVSPRRPVPESGSSSPGDKARPLFDEEDSGYDARLNSATERAA